MEGMTERDWMLGWQVAVIMLATLPLMFGTGRVMAYFITKYTVMGQQSYALAGSVAEACFQSIRTIYSFTLQKRFSKRYDEKLEEACQFGIKRGVSLGLGFATFMFILFCTYGLALWYGSTKGKYAWLCVCVCCWHDGLIARTIYSCPRWIDWSCCICCILGHDDGLHE